MAEDAWPEGRRRGPLPGGSEQPEPPPNRLQAIVVTVDIREGGPGTNRPSSQRRYILNDYIDKIIPCFNPRCRDGGIAIHGIVDELLERGERKQLCLEVCAGLIAREDGHSSSTQCQNLFGVHVTLAQSEHCIKDPG